MMADSLNLFFIELKPKIEQWFEQRWQESAPLFYGSIDLRDAGFKMAPVDTNLFPAGFNNLSEQALNRAANAVKNYLHCYFPAEKQLLIVPESHTRNLFYLENLKKLVALLKEAGIETRIGSLDPDIIPENTFDLEKLVRQDDKLGVANFFPRLILLNNDLSSGVPHLLENLQQIILPPLSLGWHKRLKSTHFYHYNKVCQEFAQHFNFDPWLISTLFDHCNEVDFLKRKGEGCLAARAERLLFQIKQKYKTYNIAAEPFLIVKADSGTYGMGVMTIKDPQELLHLNRKQRTKMSASKGGQEVHAAIIQEGVPTITRWQNNITAEPVLYGIGSEVVGGFYRAHDHKDVTESLNAPGMQFHPFEIDHSADFYSYTVIARLAFLAAAHEQKEVI